MSIPDFGSAELGELAGTFVPQPLTEESGSGRHQQLLLTFDVGFPQLP